MNCCPYVVPKLAAPRSLSGRRPQTGAGTPRPGPHGAALPDRSGRRRPSAPSVGGSEAPLRLLDQSFVRLCSGILARTPDPSNR